MRFNVVVLSVVFLGSGCFSKNTVPPTQDMPPCERSLIEGGYTKVRGGVQHHYEHAVSLCKTYGPEQVALGKELVDKGYNNNLTATLKLIKDASPESLACAKEEFDAVPGRKGIFQFSPKCRLAHAPAAATASENHVLSVAEADTRLSTFVELVRLEPLLVAALAGPGPLTLFAPTNDAFAARPASDLQHLKTDTDFRLRFLQRYVATQAQPFDELKAKAAKKGKIKDGYAQARLDTLLGKMTLTAKASMTTGLSVNGAAIADEAGSAADNGRVYVIDKLIFN